MFFLIYFENKSVNQHFLKMCLQQSMLWQCLKFPFTQESHLLCDKVNTTMAEDIGLPLHWKSVVLKHEAMYRITVLAHIKNKVLEERMTHPVVEKKNIWYKASCPTVLRTLMSFFHSLCQDTYTVLQYWASPM